MDNRSLCTLYLFSPSGSPATELRSASSECFVASSRCAAYTSPAFMGECDATERALHWKNIDFRIEQLPNHLFKQLWCTPPRTRRRTNIVSEKDEPAVASNCALDQVMDRTSGQNVWNKLDGTQLPKINASSVHVGPDAAT